LCRNVRCTHAYVRALHSSLVIPSLRQGILFIAVRRPYDLGDRIYMKDPSISNVDYDYFASWFIEGNGSRTRMFFTRPLFLSLILS
jgi:hypothetical protein